MTDIIKINTDRLKNDTSDIAQHISSIRKLITDLTGHNLVLDGMWDGPSSEAFKMAFQSDIAMLDGIMGSLEELNRFEDNARQKYDECEGKVSELVDQIKIR